jgi:hypothetical protein
MIIQIRVVALGKCINYPTWSEVPVVEVTRNSVLIDGCARNATETPTFVFLQICISGPLENQSGANMSPYQKLYQHFGAVCWNVSTFSQKKNLQW